MTDPMLDDKALEAPASPQPALAVKGHHPLEIYANSYAQMSRMGDGKVNCRSVEVDIRQNMIPVTQALVVSPPPSGEVLGRFGHHPDPAIDFEVEVGAIEAQLIETKAGPFDQIKNRIFRAMAFNVGGDEISIRAKQSLREMEKDVAALSSAPATADGWRPTHRHVKRGSEYALIGYGRMQTANWREPMSNTTTGSVPVDLHSVAIYRSVDDGSLWARPREEFEDGRFETLPAAPTATGGR